MRAVLLCVLATGLVRGAPLGQRSLDAQLRLIDGDLAELEKMLHTPEDDVAMAVNIRAMKYKELHKEGGYTDEDLAAAGFKHVRQCSSFKDRNNDDPEGCKNAYTRLTSWHSPRVWEFPRTWPGLNSATGAYLCHYHTIDFEGIEIQQCSMHTEEEI